MNNEYPGDGVEANPSSTELGIGADAVDAVVTGGADGDKEWDDLNDVVETARGDFGGDRVDETPENTIGRQIEGWPEEAREIFIDRLAVRLLRLRLQSSDVPVGFGQTARAGNKLPCINIDARVLCDKQIKHQENALLANDPSWEGAEHRHNLADRARSDAEAHERLAITQLGTDPESLTQFEGGLVGAKVVERASVDLSEKLIEGIKDWARTGAKPSVEDDDHSIDATIQRAVVDAINFASERQQGNGEIERQDRWNMANAAISTLSFGNILAGDKRTLGYEQTAETYPNMFGFLSLDNVVAYMDKYWAERQQKAIEATDEERAKKKELLADLSMFVSTGSQS